jgi:hypothetical protein
VLVGMVNRDKNVFSRGSDEEACSGKIFSLCVVDRGKYID